MCETSLSRKQFLAGAAAGIGGLAIGASQLGSPSKAAAKPTRESETTFDHEYDVVVVGGGGAGLSAAIEAAEAGCSVAVIEYEATPFLCGTSLSGGVFMAAESVVQEAAGISDSKAEWRKYIDAVGGGFEDPALMDIWVENAADNLKWLIDMGCEFPPELLYMSGNEASYEDVTPAVARGAVTNEQSGHAIMTVLYDKSVELGVEEFFETTAERLVTSDDGGTVVGVVTDKGTFKANAGVVLCAAGFSRNKEWIKSFKPDLATGGSFGSSRQQGDGIKMGMGVGAKIGNMWITQADTIGTQQSETMWPCMVIAIWKLPCIFVSSDAKRHMAEDLYYELQSPLIAEQDGGYVWSIWDQTITDMGGQTICVPAVSAGCEQEIANGTIFKDDTIEGLAEQLGLDPATLAETVAHYNEMMEAGIDEDFGRTTGLGTVSNPPYYAAKTVPATCDTAGGLVVTTDMQVLDVFDEPIAGLYAAGSNISGWRGKLYQGSGTAVSCAVTFGRIAGQSVAKNKA